MVLESVCLSVCYVCLSVCMYVSVCLCRHQRMSDVIRLVNSSSVDVLTSTSTSAGVRQCHIICSCQQVTVTESLPSDSVSVTVADNYWRLVMSPE